ncbi:chemotaxis protein CheY [Actibacterium mucosum KCTC 23349]|uniref:Chemotaxis protein CheY n=1 Tax=Actibacterium mucosum KCTC 23349 TaxID=1454373 RepID=A0A037ZIV7_9RHOB|nr:response regulator [Actibacterium mucosum]KAJ56043.1 chemotaxis protein CheY [Actibacterium mucosum KCTC 23349]
MGRNVLLIEDEPNIIEAIRFILSRDGWDVRTHSDGTTAMDKVQQFAPDVVILDVMLPGRSGFDILREIRATGPLAALPVLMLTAKGQTRDREMAESLGVTQFMTKPFSNEDVLSAVRDMAEA